MSKVRTRFAPSPTGYMHIGNLRTALYAYLVAKHDNGDFILRIEDTDQAREVEGACDIIYSTLNACNLNYDEGPNKDGGVGPYIQSERVKAGIYKEYAWKLVELGGAHVCFCKSEDIEAQRELANARGESFLYHDPCKNLSKAEIQKRIDAGEPYVIRQTIDTFGSTSYTDEVYGTITVDNNTMDEQILLKSDGFPTYNFANVIDDHLMGITHVVRGNEFLSSTPKYNLMYDAFGWNQPKYIHCPPVMKNEHEKLSKRNGDASFQDLVAKGYLPQAILNYIALLGWSPETEQEIYSLDELCVAFNVQHIGTSGAIFDINKLTWMNGVYLRNMDLPTYETTIEPWLNQGVKNPNYDHHLIAEILHQRVNVLSEIPEMIDFLDTFPQFDTSLYTNKKMKSNPQMALPVLIKSNELLENLNEWDYAHLHDLFMDQVAKMGLKNGQVMFPVRVAISGKAFTPGGCMEIAHILGKEETLARLTRSIKQLETELNQ